MSRARRRLVMALAIVAFACTLVLTATASARPGGGGSYSGGGGHGGGGHSGGGGDGGALFEIFFFLLRLCIEVPVVGIPLMIVFFVVVIAVVVSRSKRSQYSEWQSTAADDAGPAWSLPQRGFGQPVPQPARPPRRSVRASLESLRHADPGFSVVLLEDFLYALYAELHTARGRGTIDRYSSYLSARAREAFVRAPAASVRSIVVGAMKLTDARGTGPADSHARLGVEFHVNYTEIAAGGREQSYYVVEQWSCVRQRGAQTRPPDRVRVFGCPSCGAPLDAVIAGKCHYCQRQVNTGAFDWVVDEVHVMSREPRGPMLTADVTEVGTELPTVIDRDARSRIEALRGRDPAFDWNAFTARVSLIFGEFQLGWSSRELARMRPFLSDNLFQTQVYWVETYKAQRLRNVTENARITGVELARVTSDRVYDAITIRLRATSLDYTLEDGSGKVVCGSRTRPRAYTEYWTLIRGSSRKGPPRTDAACPNCGAPLQINMAGHCGYCKAKVTSGEFDWVLSHIEQDEDYEG